MLGTRADGYAPFQGRLDEVALFDAALAPEQVQAHFAAAKAMTPARDVDAEGRAAGLLAAWTKPKGSGRQQRPGPQAAGASWPGRTCRPD